MFRGDRYVKPKVQSVAGAFTAAVLLWMGSYLSSIVGYLVALLSMVMIVVALYTESIWPRERKAENTFVFSLFWGCMLGALLPFLVTVYLEGGVEALYEVFTSEPKQNGE